MNLYDAAWQISDLLEGNRSVLMRTEPEVPDFTSRASFKLVICGNNQRLDLDVTPENIIHLTGQLDSTIFSKDCVDRLYTWHFKSFATYFHAFCPKYVLPTTNLIDLSIIENFLGIRKNRPENLIEGVNRAKATVSNKGWLKLYKPLYLPLALKILPSIETTPLLNEAEKCVQYPYYEIEGQVNGRMNCLKKFKKCYIPHRIGPEDRRNLKPRGYGYRFLSADFRHCEVTVLQWLSGDTRLKDLLDSGQDLHKAIYEALAQEICDTEKKRDLSKMIFLPVMYGCGPTTLNERTGLPIPVCKDLILRIRSKFKMAWDWMMAKQTEAKTGQVRDYFDRTRKFGENESYAARNFVVQGVAATACQEKLVELFGALNNPEKAYIAFSVHDGFGLVVQTNAARETYKSVKEILEAESKLCPGLKMKVQIKFGGRLDSMKVLWND
jgi:hypothetical protein